MKLPDISALALTAIVALATALGGFLSSLADAVLIDASTEKQAEVQILQLAISILGEEIPDSEEELAATVVLRGWAFDTINSVAEVKLSDGARTALVEGKVVFPIRLSQGAIDLAEGGGLFAMPIVYESMRDVLGSDSEVVVIAPPVTAIDLSAPSAPAPVTPDE